MFPGSFKKGHVAARATQPSKLGDLDFEVSVTDGQREETDNQSNIFPVQFDLYSVSICLVTQHPLSNDRCSGETRRQYHRRYRRHYTSAQFRQPRPRSFAPIPLSFFVVRRPLAPSQSPRPPGSTSCGPRLVLGGGRKEHNRPLNKRRGLSVRGAFGFCRTVLLSDTAIDAPDAQVPVLSGGDLAVQIFCWDQGWASRALLDFDQGSADLDHD